MIDAMKCGALVLLLALVALPGCSTSLDCGPGTHQEGDQCVPNIPQNCTGDNVVFRDGRCQPSPSVCAEGSKFDPESGVCIPADDDNPPNNDPNNDQMDADDGPEDITEDVTKEVIDDDIGPDVPEEDIDEPPPLPTCGEESATNTVCVSGQVLDWSNNTPLNTDETLGVLVDDLTLRTLDPAKAPFGQSLLGPAGGFAIEDVPINSDDGPLTQMILIVGPPPEVPNSGWQRTLTGVNAVVEGTEVYNGVPAFAVPSGLVQAWNAELGLEGDDALENTGFLLIRVLANTENGPVPVIDATVTNINELDDALIQKHYLDDNLIAFRDEDTTGRSGAVLMRGAPTGNYTATAPGFFFNTTLGGNAPGVAITTAIIGVVE